MGKKSTAAGALGDATKNGKRVTTPCDPDALMIGEWDRSKFVQKDLCNTAKDWLLKEDPEEVQVPGRKTTPTPPAGIRVMFLAFILRGLSFLAHDFLWGLLFVYGVQLHDLTPNTVLHIACLSCCASASWGSNLTRHSRNGSLA
jgi:hypothetical protein